MYLRTEELDLDLNLTKEQNEELVKYISTSQEEWDRKRDSQKQQFEKMKEAIYADITSNTPKSSVEQNNVLLPQVYEQFQTLKANIWKSNFANYDMMFNVEGRSAKDQQNSPMQKASLKQVFRDMELNNELEKALVHFLDKGEFILFVGWETRLEQIRNKEMVDEPINDPYTGMPVGVAKVQKTVRSYRTKYDGPKVSAIDPLSFVYDSSKIDDPDSCPKIYRSISTVEAIIENEIYQEKLTPQMEKELKALVKRNLDSIETGEYGDPELQGIQGDQVEVLECWGDIKLKDGTILKNYLATVVARKYLVRCECNPYIDNPFVFHRHMPDPETTRGRSMLIPAIPINQVSSQILNAQIKALKLTLNPPYVAPMGMFTTNRIELYPGKVIEYNDMFSEKYPQPLGFKDAMMGFDFLQLLETKIEGATGGFKYMVGAQDQRSRTATETSALVTGQNTRLSMIITFLNSQAIVSMINKVARLMSNFMFEDTEVRNTSNAGTPGFSTITSDIRQGNYEYVYGDSQSVVEMEAKMKKIGELLQPFAQMVPINWAEFLKMTFQKLNIEDADRVLMTDPIDEALSSASPEMKIQIKEMIVQSGMLDQLIQQMVMAKGGTPSGSQPSGSDMGAQNAAATQSSNFPGAAPISQ